MTPQERLLLEEAEQSVFDSMETLEQPTSGIRPPPLIEETEGTLEPQLFGLEFGARPESEVFPVSTAPPEFVCPTCVEVTFHGVIFDCGCISFAPVVPNYGTFTDVSFNDTPYTLTTFAASHCIGDCSLQGAPDLGVRQRLFGTSDCSGTPGFDRLTTVTAIRLMFISGIYYLFADGGFSCPGVFFYGTSTTLGGPYTNTSVCTSSPIDWDNPLIECYFGGPFTVPGAAHGGTATIVTC